MTWTGKLSSTSMRPTATTVARRNVAGGTPYGRKALEHEADELRSAPEGTRNDRLNTAAFAVGQLVAGGELDEGEARDTMLDAAAACGLGAGESARTFASGFEAGLREPRSAPPRPEARAPHRKTNGSSNGNGTHSQQESSEIPEPPPGRFDDDGVIILPDRNGAESEPNRPLQQPDLALISLGSLVEPALARAARRRAGDELPVPVPWPSFAESIGGGFWPGAHFLVSGTGVGKSQLTIQIGLHAALAGVPVAYIGLELDDAQIALRVLAEKTGLKWSGLYLGRCSADELERAKAAGPLITGLPFYVDFGSSHGWPASRLELLVKAMRGKHPTGPLLVVLDYLQLVGDEVTAFDRRPDLRERIGSAAYAARDVARRYDASVLVVSSVARAHYGLLAGDVREAGLVSREQPGQLGRSRSILNPHVLVGLGKESGELEFSADTVTVLVRWPAPLESGETAVLVAVPKVRCGLPRWSAMRFWGRFEELPIQSLDDLPEPPSRGGRGNPVSPDDMRARVLETVRRQPGLKSMRAIAERTTGRQTDLFKAIKTALADGALANNDGAFEVVPSGSQAEGGNQ